MIQHDPIIKFFISLSILLFSEDILNLVPQL